MAEAMLVFIYLFWECAGELFFITDRQSGFWNLYKWVKFSFFIFYYPYVVSNFNCRTIDMRTEVCF